jgi:hypothetical protein
MTDYYGSKSSSALAAPTPSPEVGLDTCLFSQNSCTPSGVLDTATNIPSGVATMSTQSTVPNYTQPVASPQAITGELDSHQEVLPLIAPLQIPQPRKNPVRSGRPPDGNTEHLTILLDTVEHGKLPEDYQPSGLPPCEIVRLPGDTQDSWVAQSHFFPGAGMSYFFEIKGPYQRRGGALLAVYYGQDSNTRSFAKHSHKQLSELWSKRGFALSHRGANYVVDGDQACGPAYINDGFDRVNVYFSYSKANKRMEVRTRGPMDPGKYEAMVNYDEPHYPSGYWTKERRSLLPPETLARLVATYPAKVRPSRKVPGGSKSGRRNLLTTEQTECANAP